jgi:hypothetical protein
MNVNTVAIDNPISVRGKYAFLHLGTKIRMPRASAESGRNTTAT